MSLAQLKSDELRRAAQDALGGAFVRFEQMLAFHSGLPGPRPNFALAEAVGAALAGERGADRVIRRLADNVAAPDTAEVFLPVVGAHAYAARAVRGELAAWDALEELCADERGPVRAGTENALLLAARQNAVDGIVSALTRWLDDENRDRRWGAAATVLDALATERAMEGLADRQALLDAVTTLIADVADAPRAAERSEGRRRLLAALARITAAIVSSFRAEPDGAAWLTERLSKARHPDVRHAFDEALARLKKRGGAEKVATLEAMHAALASSAKPDRHAARRHDGMTGRGKKKKARG
jgi:hypothetical protein